MASGVYVIEHIATGRRYVGSAVDLVKRWKEHRRQLMQGRHHSRFLQRAWDKCGPEAFSFRVALLCDRVNLLFYEQALIDFYRPEYNSAPTAGSQLGFKMSDEAKAKMSQAAKRTRNFTGHQHSEETKRQISASRKGKVGGPRTPELRAKISAALKGKVCPSERRERISASLSGRSTGRGALTEAQVREVRAMRSKGMGRIRIGRALGISASAASAVIGGHAYLWVK